MVLGDFNIDRQGDPNYEPFVGRGLRPRPNSRACRAHSPPARPRRSSTTRSSGSATSRTGPSSRSSTRARPATSSGTGTCCGTSPARTSPSGSRTTTAVVRVPVTEVMGVPVAPADPANLGQVRCYTRPVAHPNAREETETARRADNGSLISTGLAAGKRLRIYE
jgi:hypothetical protein